MNIGHMMRQMFGEFQSHEARTIELKPGQVVKGVVLQVISSSEAWVEINGVQMRAKLEAPLEQGLRTLLQVQPESANGQIVLKPLQSSSVPIAEQSLIALLKDFSMKDTAGNRQVLQWMQQYGVPLTRANVEAFSQLSAAIPVQIPSEEWIQSASIAQQKGLPLNADSVKAIHQVLFGKPAFQLLSQIESQVGVWLRQGEASSLSGSAQIRGQLTQLLASLGQVKQIIMNHLGPNAAVSNATISNSSQQVPLPMQGGITAQPGTSSSGSLNPTTVLSGQQGSTMLSGSAQASASIPSQSASVVPPNANLNTQSSAQAASQASDLVQGKIQGSQGNAQLNQGSAQITVQQQVNSQAQIGSQGHIRADVATNLNANQTASHAGQSELLRAEANEQLTSTVNATTTMINQATSSLTVESSDRGWVNALFKSLGFSHERNFANFITGNSSVGQLTPDQSASQSLNQNLESLNTFKGQLIQLTQASEVPATIRESAQQLLQQITGQQLFMVTDRAAMFSHITMFLPFHHDGQPSAAVHIQSRKNKKGQLDAQNCRLLFDLNMQVMGPTVIDVQIVDRIVSLKVMNDHPFIGKLFEQTREEIASQLEGVGYHFSSLKVSAFPIPKATEGLESTGETILSSISNFTRSTYKGVDMKI